MGWTIGQSLKPEEILCLTFLLMNRHPKKIQTSHKRCLDNALLAPKKRSSAKMYQIKRDRRRRATSLAQRSRLHQTFGKHFFSKTSSDCGLTHYRRQRQWGSCVLVIKSRIVDDFCGSVVSNVTAAEVVAPKWRLVVITSSILRRRQRLGVKCCLLTDWKRLSCSGY